MNRYIRILVYGFGLAIASLAVSHNPQTVVAAASPAPTGITVSPAFQQVSISSTESEHPVTFRVTNNKSVPQTMALSSADFNTLNESGGLLFVGTNPTQLQKKYGLATWLSLPLKQITIPPKQTQTINANILNIASMPAGGHYGALMLAAVAAGSNQPSNISVHPIASSLLFVTKLGGDTHKLGLSNVALSHTLFSLPGSVTIRFHNDGNTHLIPRGTVTTNAPGGKLISKGIINDDSGIILPGTFRRYYVPLVPVLHSNAAGKYTINVNFRFDGLNQFRSYKQSFIYVPAIWLLAIIIIVAGASLLVVMSRRLKK